MFLHVKESFSEAYQFRMLTMNDFQEGNEGVSRRKEDPGKKEGSFEECQTGRRL